jgi:uncharacterized protein YjiS (DUF1127 family)
LPKLCSQHLAAAQQFGLFSCIHGHYIGFREESAEFGRFKGHKAMLTSLIRFIRAWKRYNHSLYELGHLDDRELADIGISRSDIPRLAWDYSQKGSSSR